MQGAIKKEKLKEKRETNLQKDQKVCLYQSSHKTSHAMNHIKACSVRSFQGDYEVV